MDSSTVSIEIQEEENKTNSDESVVPLGHPGMAVQWVVVCTGS